MNRTRIEIATIPPDLAAPHFDDDATIVSARQVVPIAQAKVTERSHTLLSIIPILVGAAVFGALGALGANYFENHLRGNVLVSGPRSEISQPINQAPRSQPQSATQGNSGSELPGGALASSGSSSPGLDGTPAQSQTGSQTTDPTTGQETVDSTATDNKPAPAAQPNSGSFPEPGKLMRKRRVHPPTMGNDGKPGNPPKGKRGAGRIQEIFAGPNPQ